MKKIRKLCAALIAAALTAALAVTVFASSASAQVSITAGSAKTLSFDYEGYGLEGSFEMSGDTDSFELESSYVFLYSTASEGSTYLADTLSASAVITASSDAAAGESVTVTFTYYTFDINGVESGPLTYTWEVTVSEEASSEDTKATQETTAAQEDETTASSEETTESVTSPQTGDYSGSTVEIEPTYNFCNITAHKVIVVLFCISLAANIVFVVLAVMLRRRKKKDKTPLVKYDISDDD